MYLPTDVPFHDLPVHFHILVLINRYDLPVLVSTALQHPVYLFIFMLLFRLTTKTYLSPQLLVCMPVDVPVHDATC